MAGNEIQPAAEFQALPLEFIVASPLTAVVKAQAVAAEATRGFIMQMMKDKKPITVDFDVEYQSNETGKGKGQTKTMSIRAPLLSIVPVPHLKIDALTVHFRYEISQISKSNEVSEKGVEMGAQTGALLSPWASATLKGSVSSKSSEESTTNRSGLLEITVHASEAPVPEGLAKILSLLANSIQAPPPAPAGP
ncbi:MAG: DUF2589 domain-containing protein [Candidatus Manganitrophaceae bacterium]